MNSSSSSSSLSLRDYSVLSNFTLAFFEDSGWYKVNYSSLEDLHQFDLLWGKGKFHKGQSAAINLTKGM